MIEIPEGCIPLGDHYTSARPAHLIPNDTKREPTKEMIALKLRYLAEKAARVKQKGKS